MEVRKLARALKNSIVLHLPRPILATFLPRKICLYGHYISDSDNASIKTRYRYPSICNLVDTCEFLKRQGYRFLALPEFCNASKNDKVVLLTFDDGFQNIATEVFPVLNLLKLPFAVFLITEPFEDSNYSLAIFDKIHENTPKHLTLEQCKYLTSEGVHLGFHTRTHKRVTTEIFSEAQFESEILHFKKFQDIFSAPLSFAYPFSAPDNFEKFDKRLAAVGFESIFDTKFRSSSLGIHHFRIPMDTEINNTCSNPIIFNLNLFVVGMFLNWLRAALMNVLTRARKFMPKKEINWFHQGGDFNTSVRHDVVEFKESYENVQNKLVSFRNAVIDLRQDYDHICRKFDPKFLYEVRRAAKEGITTEVHQCGTLKQILEILPSYRNFSARKKIDTIPNHVLEGMIASEKFFLASARTPEVLLQHHFYFVHCQETILLASFPNENAQHLHSKYAGWGNRILHAHAIRYFKENGLAIYNLGGIGNANSIGNENIIKFKMEMSPDIKDYFNGLVGITWYGKSALFFLKPSRFLRKGLRNRS